MIVVRAHVCKRCEDLARENAELREFRDKAMAHIDDLQAIVADQREKLQMVGQPKPAPRPGGMRARIREHQKRELALEAYRYLQEGAAEKQYLIRCPEELERVIGLLLQTAGRGNPLQIVIREAV